MTELGILLWKIVLYALVADIILVVMYVGLSIMLIILKAWLEE